MTLAGADDLAQELVDAVLDFLHDDRASLFVTALVARKWVPASRFHTFDCVALTHFFTGRAKHLFKDSAHSFLELCRSPYCTIIPAIQDVLLDIDAEKTPTLLEDLVAVLAQAPVSKLRFIDHTRGYQKPAALSWMAESFPRLQHLSYTALDQFMEDVYALLASLPKLRTLSLSSCATDAARNAITSHDESFSAPTPPFVHLRSVRIRLFADQADEFMRWLGTCGHSVRLETLEVETFHCYHSGWGPISSLNAFLAANGQSLAHFGLCLRYEDDRAVDQRVLLLKHGEGELDLSALTNLQTLKLWSHNIDSTCAALHTLPAHPKSTSPLATFELSYRHWIHYEQYPCECDGRFLVHDLGEAMARDVFTGLRSFRILVPDMFGDEWWDALREFFPRWEGTEVLQIGFSGEGEEGEADDGGDDERGGGLEEWEALLGALGHTGDS